MIEGWVSSGVLTMSTFSFRLDLDINIRRRMDQLKTVYHGGMSQSAFLRALLIFFVYLQHVNIHWLKQNMNSSRYENNCVEWHSLILLTKLYRDMILIWLDVWCVYTSLPVNKFNQMIDCSMLYYSYSSCLTPSNFNFSFIDKQFLEPFHKFVGLCAISEYFSFNQLIFLMI